MSIEISVQTITPQLAREMLKKNTRNRPLREKYCDKLADAMTRGEWELNGDAIRFDVDGSLIDGQHRLTGIVLSGVPIQSVVIKALSSTAFLTIDAGIVKSTADIFSIRGKKHSVLLAATTRLLHTYLVTGNPHSGNEHPTRKQQEELLEKNPAIYQSASWTISSTWARKFIPPGVACFCHFLFTERDPHAAPSFFLGLDSGAGLRSDSPILLLRNRLAESKGSKEQLNPTYRTALIFKAFKLHRDGASVRYLRLRTEGNSPEKDIFTL